MTITAGLFRNRVLRGLVFFIVSGAGMPNLAIAAFEPALPASGERGFQSVMKMPEKIVDGVYRFRCEAIINPNGRARQVTCLSQLADTSKQLLQAVSLASENAIFTPAREHGDAIEVFMQFSVLIRVDGKNAMIGVFPNDGEHWTSYGMNYVSPQRVEGGFGRMNFVDAVEGQTTAHLKMRLRIGVNGEVLKVAFEEKTGLFIGRELNNLKRSIKRMKFRPGLHNGVPTEMDYVELYFRTDSAGMSR